MPTMADIARRAGVALSTVSHTLSGKRPVSPEVRARVMQAIAELEYQPHALARALATKRTRTIALLYPSAVSGMSPPLEFIAGVLMATKQRRYGLLLWTAPDDDQEVLRMTQQGFIDGLILMEVKLEDPRTNALREQNYPFTMIGHCRENGDINFVDLDFDYAIHTAVEHLAALGHEHIAFINHSAKLLEGGLGYIVRCEEAFWQATAARHLHARSYTCESNAQAGYQTVNKLLDEDPEVTAIININAWISGGITRALTDRSLEIPADISLVGIVSSQIAEMTVPHLTTVDFPFSEMGRIGADMLIRQLEGEQVNSQILLRPPLIVRQSSGPATQRPKQKD